MRQDSDNDRTEEEQALLDADADADLLEILQEAQDERVAFNLSNGLRGRIFEIRTAVNVPGHVTEILFEIINTDHPFYQSIKRKLGDDWHDGWEDPVLIGNAYDQAVDQLR